MASIGYTIIRSAEQAPVTSFWYCRVLVVLLIIMVLWVDKYRPRTFAKLDLHPEITSRLQSLVSNNDLPHLLFYGPPGSGKKTRINAILRELYGTGVEKVRVQHKSIKGKSKIIEIATLQSNYHIEITPSEAGQYDRQVIQEVIKEMAQTTNVTSVLTMTANSSTSSSTAEKHNKQFKVVILNEVDRLSMAAQQALRRTMEKYTYTSESIIYIPLNSIAIIYMML